MDENLNLIGAVDQGTSSTRFLVSQCSLCTVTAPVLVEADVAAELHL